MNRRKFLKRAGLVGGVGTLTGLYAWQVEPYWLEFVRRPLVIEHLPNDLVGKTLMQISDIHVGNRFDYGWLIDSFKRARRLKPDLVVYTGDYVSYDDPTQHDQLTKVLEHGVRGSLGTVAILGNHDYGHGWQMLEVAERITEQLGKVGITVLRNEQTTVAGLNIIGLDDYYAPNFAPSLVMSDYDPGRANLLLCHNPDVCDLDVWNGYRGWILAGHTHGGQCKPPFLNPPVLPIQNKQYAAGEVDLGDGRMLYVNRALGHLFPVRFNVRPEITVFTLDRARPAAPPSS